MSGQKQHSELDGQVRVSVVKAAPAEYSQGPSQLPGAQDGAWPCPQERGAWQELCRRAGAIPSWASVEDWVVVLERRNQNQKALRPGMGGRILGRCECVFSEHLLEAGPMR